VTARPGSGLTISSATLTVIGFLLVAVNTWTAVQRDDTKDLRNQIQDGRVAVARLEGRIHGLERDIDRLRQGKTD
jgi:hypothetical protein